MQDNYENKGQIQENGILNERNNKTAAFKIIILVITINFSIKIIKMMT